MRSFSTLIKPASSLCNMRCKYCFYADVADHRSVESYGVMSAQTAHNLIDRVFEYLKPPAMISFGFQGGEPTMAGIEYFRDFVRYAKEKNQGRFQIHYALQTNGYLIDEEWCRLFKEHDFLVGVSMDGDAATHDRYRLDARRQGTHDRVRAAIKLLDKHGVAYNVLSVITSEMARHAQRVFSFYVKQRIQYVQLIPCLQPLDSEEPGEHDLTGELYADFMKRFFALWAEEWRKGRYFSVRQFDNLINLVNGYPAEQCGMMGYCTPQFVVEADGGVYPCDFYVLDRYLSGNVNTDSVEAISKSAGTQNFMADKVEMGPLCANCRVFGLCGGGCKRYRAFYNQKPGYCPYQDFLYAAYPVLMQIARSVRG